MEKDEDSGSPGWSAFMPTSEDFARAVAAAAAAVRAPRQSVIYSSKDESGSPLQKFQHQFSRILKGISTSSEVKSGSYNPEILTSHKRQWANFQLQLLDHRVWKEPSNIFESMVVVGLPPSFDLRALEKLYFARKIEGSGRLRTTLGGQHQTRIEPNLEPQVLFVYPPEKQLPLKYKDLLSFCFPAGVEVNAVEKTPSMSELNEILLGQEHLKQSDQYFIFRLKVADASTLYGCCVLVEEMIQKPSGLISTLSDGQPGPCSLSRHILITRRCYCILSRLPFFELHFGVLNSIFTEERFERLMRQINNMDFISSAGSDELETSVDKAGNLPSKDSEVSMRNELEDSQAKMSDSLNGRMTQDISSFQLHSFNQEIRSNKGRDVNAEQIDPNIEKLSSMEEPVVHFSISDNFNAEQIDLNIEKLSSREEPVVHSSISDNFNDLSSEGHLPHVVQPLLQCQQCESSESSSSYQGSSSEDRLFRSDAEDAETEEASPSGQDVFREQSDILEWAKANKHGSLQIICEYYKLTCPLRGSTIKFQPLDHLHTLEYYRPDETVLQISGSEIDLRSCNTSLELAEVQNALMLEEEAASLSVWAIACLCGSLRLDHVLMLFAGALLEKQIVIVCSNLGTLSALVLSIIPLIRPYQWQSLLMPVLPNDMLDFLDAPVPYIVGLKNKTAEVQSKLTNVVMVDANRNQVKSPSLPQLPQYRELYSSLSPYHAKLVGESYLAKKRPVYECTDLQVEAAKGFLDVLRTYMDTLCSNLRSHTITNVQSNDDKVSLLLKESFIESFPSRDQPFMKLFVDTQLFSVHTDFILSLFQKE